MQYLNNISKKKLGMEFCKLALSFLMEVARHVQSNQNRKLVKFLQYIKKKVMQLLLHSIMMQNIQILYRVPVILVVPCFWVVVVKNRCGLLDQGNLNLLYLLYLLYLKNDLMKWSDFLHADANLGELNINLIIIGWVCSKMSET